MMCGCGAEVNYGEKFCWACGEKLNADAIVSKPRARPASSRDRSSPQENASGPGSSTLLEPPREVVEAIGILENPAKTKLKKKKAVEAKDEKAESASAETPFEAYRSENSELPEVCGKAVPGRPEPPESGYCPGLPRRPPPLNWRTRQKWWKA